MHRLAGDLNVYGALAAAIAAVGLGYFVGVTRSSVDVAALLLIPGLVVAIILFPDRVKCSLCGLRVLRPGSVGTWLRDGHTTTHRCPYCRARLPE